MKLFFLRFMAACALCALVGLGASERTVAQITPTADPGFAPRIDTAGNGKTPVVHIVAPSAGGVSHNRYQDFHVDERGVILNNSTSGGQSQVGGAVSANPHLSGGAARVIVNEVERGRSRSQLNGPLEVVGQAADVIVANPNGISVNGGRFINTPRVTLSTGEPKINAAGHVVLQVDQGEVEIGSGGMDAGNVREVNIVGKRVKIKGRTRAGDVLDVQAGSQDYNHATRESKVRPAKGEEYAIDAYDLGITLEAGRIYFKVTDEGAGVRARTDVAGPGEYILTADGDIIIGQPGSKQNVGKLQATSKRGKVTHSGESRVAGRTELKGKSVVVAQESLIDATGILLEGNEVRVERLGWLNTPNGSIELKGVGADSRIHMNGSINTGFDLVVNSEGAYIQEGVVHAGRDAIFNAKRVSIPNERSRVDAVRDIIGNVEEWESVGDLDAHGSIRLSGKRLTNKGDMHARGELRFDASERVTNEGTLAAPVIRFVGAAPLYNNNGGSITAYPGRKPEIYLPQGGLNNDGGNFYWDGDLTWNPGFLHLGNGRFEVTGALNLTIDQDFENSGVLRTGGPMSFKVGGNWTNNGQIRAGVGGLHVEALGSVNNLERGRLEFTGPVHLVSGEAGIMEVGLLRSADWVVMSSLGSITWGGRLIANGALQLAAVNNITMQESTGVSPIVGVVSTPTPNQDPQSPANATPNNTDSPTYLSEAKVNGAVTIAAGGRVTLDGEIRTDSAFQVSSGKGFNQGSKGNIAASETVVIENREGSSFLEGTIHSGKPMLVSSLGMVSVGKGALWTVNGPLSIKVGNDWISAGTMQVSDKVEIETKFGGITQRAGSLIASGSKVDLKAIGGDVAIDGAIKARDPITIVGQEETIEIALTPSDTTQETPEDGDTPKLILKVGGNVSQGVTGILESEGSLLVGSDGTLLLLGENRTNETASIKSRTHTLIGGVLSALKSIVAVGDGTIGTSGNITSGDDISIKAKEDIVQLAGSIRSEKDVILNSEAGNLIVNGEVKAAGVVKGEAGGGFAMQSQNALLAANNGISIQAKGGGAGVGGRMVSGSDIGLAAVGEVVLGTASSLEAKKVITVEYASHIQANGLLRTEESLNILSGIGEIAFGETSRTEVGGDARFTTLSGISHAGKMRVGGNSEWSALGGGISQSGNLEVEGDLKLVGASAVSTAGKTASAGVLDIKSGGSYTNRGYVGSEYAVGIEAGHQIENYGVIASSKELDLKSTGAGIVNNGIIRAKGYLKAKTAGGLSQEGGKIIGGNEVEIDLGGGFTNVGGTVSARDDLFITSKGRIWNQGGLIVSGNNAILRGTEMVNTTRDGGLVRQSESVLPDYPGWDRYVVSYPNLKVYTTTIDGVIVKYLKEVVVMGYYREQYYGEEGSVVSAKNNLTIDVGSGRNEASTILSGNVATVNGEWDNKSNYLIFSNSWLTMDEGMAENDTKTREQEIKNGERWHLIWGGDHKGTKEIGITDNGQNTLKVFRYAEDQLGINPKGGGKDSEWLAMASAVPIGGLVEKSYERFHIKKDDKYRKSEIGRKGVISGGSALTTNGKFKDDDYAISEVGQGGVLTDPLGVGGADTGLGGGYQISVNIQEAIKEISAVDAVGPLDAIKAVGEVNDPKWVDAAGWLDRIPTRDELKPVFELAGYNPYPDVPSNTIEFPSLPSGEIVQKGLPEHVFSVVPKVDSQSGRIPDLNTYFNDLGRKADETDPERPAKVTISEELKKQLEAIKADESLRTITENIGLDRSKYAVAESTRRPEFDELSKNGIFGDNNGGSGGLFEYAGPMLYPSTAGIVFLKRLQRPDIGKTIEERSIRLLAEEERIKSDRAAYIKLLMGKGYSQEEATKKAYKKFGEGYFERQERITAEQNQRLYLEQNPPESGGLFGGNGVLGIVAAVGIAVVLAALAWFAIPAIAGALLPMLTSLGVAAEFAATAIATSVVGAVSGFVSNTTSQLMNGVKFDVVDALKAAGIAAAMAVAAYGVGHAPGLKELWETGKVFDSISVPNLALKPLLHGAAQGGISVAAGGEFTQGFLSGAFSSVSGSLINSIGGSDQITRLDMLGRAFAGAAAGAGGAALVNGDIALGAIQGGFVQLFNDELKRREDGKAIWSIEKGGLLFKDIVIGLEDGDRIYLSEEYGGGWIPARLAREGIAVAGDMKDLRLLSAKEQQEFMKFSFTAMKEGRILGKVQFTEWLAYKFNEGIETTTRGVDETLPKIKSEVTRLVNEGKLDKASGLVARFGLTVGSNTVGELVFVPTRYLDASKALGTSNPVTIVGAGIESYGKQAGNNIANFIQNPSAGTFYDLADTITETSPMFYGAWIGKASLTQKLAGFKPIGSAVDNVQNSIVWPPNRGFLNGSDRGTLQPGSLIDRYGNPDGTFVAPKDTLFELRSLPNEFSDKPLMTYEVLKPIDADVGISAPWFDKPGGGIQIELPQTVQELIDAGYLRPVTN